jgi:hypothetical protein
MAGASEHGGMNEHENRVPVDYRRECRTRGTCQKWMKLFEMRLKQSELWRTCMIRYLA